MHKRGLSSVVTSVLFILLVLVIVSLLSVTIFSFLRTTSNGYGFDTITTNIEIIPNSPALNAQNGLVFFSVKRNPGDGALIGIRVLLEDEANQQKAVDLSLTLKELEWKELIIDYEAEGITELTSVSIAPVFERNGEPFIGSVSDSFDVEVLGPEIIYGDCFDGDDNDQDGLVDYPVDLGCDSLEDSAENVDNGNYDWYYADFPAATDLNSINWSKFPSFSLHDRFIIVYNGPHFNDSSLQPLTHGFSHIDRKGTDREGRDNLPVENRALLWTSVPWAPDDGEYSIQPWADEDLKSPWGNNLTAYRNRWLSSDIRNGMGWYADWYSDTEGEAFPNVDVIFADIERRHVSDSSILGIKNHERIPPEIAALDNDSFIDLYKRNMSLMYATALSFLREEGFNGTISSYQDGIFRDRPPWTLGNPSRTWEGYWTTNFNTLYYVTLDYEHQSPDWLEQTGPFYDLLDYNAPSPYYHFNYPETKATNPTLWNNASDYLAYHIFLIEGNNAWDENIGEEKGAIPFQWLLFCQASGGSCPDAWESLRPHMAHATAIFPYFSGAQGVWLWDNAGDDGYGINQSEWWFNADYEIYEHYIYGLYRLSQFNEFFDGDYSIYAPVNPRDLIVDNLPVWRGVVNEAGDQMLVAAHNPYAEPDETTSIEIDYFGERLAVINVSGLDTYLGVFDIS